MRISRSIAVASLAVLGAGLTTAAQADPIPVKAVLSGAAETPPNKSTGTGILAGTFDPASRKLTYSVSYSGLSGPPTAAHFHAPAPVGKPAGIEIPVKGSLANPIKGEVTLTEEQAHNLTDQQTYFNIHTAQDKAGEIRGQVIVTKSR